MHRINSGHGLDLLCGGSDASSVCGDVTMPACGGDELCCSAFAEGADGNGSAPAHGEAAESLGRGPLPPGLECVDGVISETHLLQVGAMLGERSARAALLAREGGGPVGHPDSFYGRPDDGDAFLQPWEPLLSESSSGVLYWAWRRPLRRGMHMYMTRSVFLRANPRELRTFMNDDAYRAVWDSSMTLLRPLPSPAPPLLDDGHSSAFAADSGSGAVAAAAAKDGGASACASTGEWAGDACVAPHEQAIMQAMVAFPKPMSARSYVYARRVWDRPSDGGCYCLARACGHPAPSPLPSRAVPVGDYVSGCIIREPATRLLPPGFSGSAAEILMVRRC